MFRSKMWKAFKPRHFIILLSSLILLATLQYSPVSAQFVPFGFWKKNSDPLSTYPDTTDMVALWRMNENPAQNGTTLSDYFGNHNASLATDNGTTNKSVTGILDKGVSFDGTGDVATVSGSTDFDRSTTANVTIMGWVNRQSSWAWTCFVSINYGASDANWCLGPESTDDILTYWDGVGNPIVVDVGTISTNFWHHFALVIENGTMGKIYWDGELVGYNVVDNTSRTNYNVTIGKDNWGYFTPAYLDEVSYWTRALSAEEISTVVQNQYGATNTTLVRNFRVYNITSTSFDVSLDYNGDADSDATAVLHYCNETDSASCTPSSPGVSLTKSGGKFVGSVTGLSSPNDPGDYLNLRIAVTDADGVSGTPADTQMRLAPSTPKLIYRSVAAGATAALESNNGILHMSNDVYSFDGPLGSVGIGDAIVYDPISDSATPSAIVFIREIMGASIYRVQFSDGSAPSTTLDLSNWAIYRAYTSLSNAESGTENTGIPAAVRSFDSGNRDIATNNERWHFALYANGTTADSTAVVWDGWTTDSNRYIQIYTPTLSTEVITSQRHSGVWSTSKYHLKAAVNYGAVLSIRDTHVRVEGLQIDNTFNGDEGSGINFDTTANKEIYISSNIIKASTGSVNTAYAGGIKLGSGAGTNSKFYIYNNIIYDTRANGIRNDNPGSGLEAYIYNNTIYGAYEYGIYSSAYNSNNITEIKNNILYSTVSGSDFYQAGSTTPILFEANITSDTSLNQQTITFANTASDDYHLTSGDTAALGTGTNLMPLVESEFHFQSDIDQEARGGFGGTDWDIGADER